MTLNHKPSLALAIVTLMLVSLACGGTTTIPPITPTFTPPPGPPPTVIPQPGQQDTLAPTVTPPLPPTQPPVSSVTYRVAFVAEDDTLNVRSGPGVDNDVVFELAPDSSGVRITGPGEEPGDGSFWVPIEHQGNSGWVNRYYLTEEVDAATFCADARASTIIETLIAAVRAGDSTTLAAVTHPERGLLVRMAAWNDETQIPFPDVAGLFTDGIIRDWGDTFGGAERVEGTAKDRLLPVLARDLLDETAQVTCVDILHGNTAALISLPSAYEALNYYSIYRPPIDQEENVFDWGTWAVGFDYRNGEPWLAFLVHYQWEP